MPDLWTASRSHRYDLRRRRRAALAKLILTVAVVAVFGSLLWEFLSGSFDQVFPR